MDTTDYCSGYSKSKFDKGLIRGDLSTYVFARVNGYLVRNEVVAFVFTAIRA